MKNNFSTDDLVKFINQADRPHADGTAEVMREADGSSTITFKSGAWRMHDNFFGGEPYGGRQVVYYNDRPVWLFVYYGQVTDRAIELEGVYNFLRLSLRQAPVNGFSRGPAIFKHGEFAYKNTVNGSIENFKGREVILFAGKQVYWAEYLGGLVDQRGQGKYWIN